MKKHQVKPKENAPHERKKVTYQDYVIVMQFLKRCANNFS